VAAILGLKSASRISRWEKGNCVPSLFNAFRLAILYRTLSDGLFKDLVQALREEVRNGEAKVLDKKLSPQ
jgi:transcriptional regulator with XRE-family HTH domain